MVKFFKYQKFLLYIFVCLLVPNVVHASVNNQKSYIINNNGLIIYDSEYNNLKNLGFTELEILNMNVEELERNKNLKGTVVAQNTTNLKNDNTILSNQLFGLQPGSNNTAEKKLTTTIISVNGSYRYKVTVEWNKIPVNRSNDIIGIGIDPNVKVSGTPYFKQTFCTSSNNCSSSSEHSKKVTSSGASVTYLLPSSKSITSMSAYLYFDVAKNTNSTITKLNAYGDYAHSISSVSEINALNHSINRSGIVHLDSTSKYFDTFSLSKAVWTGSW